MAFNYTMINNIGEWVKPAYGGTLGTAQSMDITDVTSARVVLLDTDDTSGGLAGTVTVQHSDADDSGFEDYERTYARGFSETQQFDLEEVESDGQVYWFDVRLDGAKYYMQIAESLTSGTAGNIEVIGVLGTDGNVPDGYQASYEASVAYPDVSR